MDSEELLQAERSLQRLVYRYTHLVDFGHASKLPDLFTADGVFDNGSLRLVGREQLVRAFTAREADRELRTRHVCTNLLLDLQDRESAIGVVYITLYRERAEGPESSPIDLRGPSIVGSYHDEYRNVAGEWLIASRYVRTPFVSPTDVGWTFDIDAGRSAPGR